MLSEKEQIILSKAYAVASHLSIDSTRLAKIYFQASGLKWWIDEYTTYLGSLGSEPLDPEVEAVDWSVITRLREWYRSAMLEHRRSLPDFMFDDALFETLAAYIVLGGASLGSHVVSLTSAVLGTIESWSHGQMIPAHVEAPIALTCCRLFTFAAMHRADAAARKTRTF